MKLEDYFQKKLYCPEMYNCINIDNGGYWAVCCRAKSTEISAYDTSIKEWQNSDHIQKLRAGDEETINETCVRCINDEATGHGIISRRQRKFQEIKHVIKTDFDIDNDNDVDELKEILMNNLYLIVRFDDDMCDLACFMCNVRNSRERVADMKRLPKYWRFFGPASEHHPTQKIDMTRYTNEVIHRIDRIIITGGEPTLIKEVHEYLEAIKHNSSHIRLDIQTNMASPKVLEKFFPYFRAIKFHVSVDGIGQYNEYLRKKSDWPRLIEKIKKYNNMEGVDVVICPTISMFNYNQIDDIAKFWAEFDGGIDLEMANWLASPKFLAYTNLPDELNHGSKETKFNKENFMLAVEYMLELDKIYNHDFKEMYPDFWDFYKRLK